MGHFEIENETPFAFEPLMVVDEDGRPLLVPVIKATYCFDEEETLGLAERQLPVNMGGELYRESNDSSYKYEPETAFFKPCTDVVLIGHAYPPGAGLVECDVRFEVGLVKKTVNIIGDRYWVKSLGMISMTVPEPFEKMPLVYERAFGGWDRSHSDPSKHSFEPRNPVGTGFRSEHGRFEEGIPLPNLEDPQNPLRNYGAMVPPAGFGFTAPDWKPRASFAGTYDEKWMNERMPLLPKNFDRRFFNAASPGLMAPGYLNGNEAVLIQNASRHGTISFNLPAVPPPECRVQLNVGKSDVRVQMNLDTVIINTDDDLVLLLWRGYLALSNGPHDVMAIQIDADGVSVADIGE